MPEGQQGRAVQSVGIVLTAAGLWGSFIVPPDSTFLVALVGAAVALGLTMLVKPDWLRSRGTAQEDSA